MPPPPPRAPLSTRIYRQQMQEISRRHRTRTAARRTRSPRIGPRKPAARTGTYRQHQARPAAGGGRGPAHRPVRGCHGTVAPRSPGSCCGSCSGSGSPERRAAGAGTRRAGRSARPRRSRLRRFEQEGACRQPRGLRTDRRQPVRADPAEIRSPRSRSTSTRRATPTSGGTFSSESASSARRGSHRGAAQLFLLRGCRLRRREAPTRSPFTSRSPGAPGTATIGWPGSASWASRSLQRAAPRQPRLPDRRLRLDGRREQAAPGEVGPPATGRATGRQGPSGDRRLRGHLGAASCPRPPAIPATGPRSSPRSTSFTPRARPTPATESRSRTGSRRRTSRKTASTA